VVEVTIVDSVWWRSLVGKVEVKPLGRTTDPISLFGEKLQQDIHTETDHFEVRQSCPSVCLSVYLSVMATASSSRTFSPPTGRV